MLSIVSLSNSVCPLPYLLGIISQTVMFGGLDGVGAGRGGGGNSHPGGTIQNCAMCSHELSIVPFGNLQSFLMLLSQYPTNYQQNQRQSQTVYFLYIIAAINQDGKGTSPTNSTITNKYSGRAVRFSYYFKSK